jgi:hypothetical protein
LNWFFKTAILFFETAKLQSSKKEFANEFFKTANVIRKIANELGIEKRNA